MPISVVVGGQFGSEGKGKVALELARRAGSSVVVRVGGTNSGHTGVDQQGKVRALRQLPAAILAPSSIAVLPPGAIIDPEILLSEIASLQLDKTRVIVDPKATLISTEDKDEERTSGLVQRIGSTGSGTGAALVRRIRRRSPAILAECCLDLRSFFGDTAAVMRDALNKNRRLIIEGSQGFGLSLLHGGYYPKSTSRDTTAGAFLGEAGLSPRDVDDITLVLRAHPIRVAGDSGPLPGETTWAKIAEAAGLPSDYQELTTATKKVRRVGRFDPELVRRAIMINNPSRIVLNHFDYVDRGVRDHQFSIKSLDFLRSIEQEIDRRIDWIGTGPSTVVERNRIGDAGNYAISR